MLRIITDFDGPIMDVSERYYQTYLFCLNQVALLGQAPTILSKEEFWRLKRSQVPEYQIGQLSGLDETQSLEFAQIRRQTVHTQPYLVYDVPVIGAIATLERLQQSNIELVTLTMRRTDELDNALTRYDLGKFFAPDRRYCLSNDYSKTNDIADKTQLMTRALLELPPADTWMVGDTEADILSAKANGIPVIGVLSGIRDRTQLQLHQPDWIVDHLAAAVEIILSQFSPPEPVSPLKTVG
ncbi:MAG: HAD family hydrolase [Leptolyngbyaceae cyanobacterium CSU_1_4]|nr:HAD family hydrolase [Leptolyngbyaceae cyanobacterium CSU_1_4]